MQPLTNETLAFLLAERTGTTVDVFHSGGGHHLMVTAPGTRRYLLVDDTNSGLPVNDVMGRYDGLLVCEYGPDHTEELRALMDKGWLADGPEMTLAETAEITRALLQTVTEWAVEIYAIGVMAEILRDIRDGIVPASVASFEDLHDHVDANEYLSHVNVPVPADVYDGLALTNAVTGAVSQWLARGGHRARPEGQ